MGVNKVEISFQTRTAREWTGRRSRGVRGRELTHARTPMGKGAGAIRHLLKLTLAKKKSGFYAGQSPLPTRRLASLGSVLMAPPPPVQKGRNPKVYTTWYPPITAAERLSILTSSATVGRKPKRRSSRSRERSSKGSTLARRRTLSSRWAVQNPYRGVHSVRCPRSRLPRSLSTIGTGTSGGGSTTRRRVTGAWLREPEDPMIIRYRFMTVRR